MQINREKFLALTATLAGFWSGSACTINLDGLTTSATLDLTTTTTTDGTTSGTTSGTTGDPTGEGGSASTTAPTTTAPTSGTTDVPQGDCCVASETPGCIDDTIEACVCAEDPLCCGTGGGFWDDICVGEVNQLGCGMCDIGNTTGDTTSEGSTGGSTGSTGGTGSTG